MSERVSGDRPAQVPRPPRVAVCGGSAPDGEDLRAAEAVGRAVAEAGAVLVCGGLGGAMAAACRGAADAGGTTIGVLPGADPAAANPWVAIPLATGMGEARNALVVAFADAIVAIGGAWGTLSEVALARAMGRPVVLLRPGLTDGLPLALASGPAEAVDAALRALAAPAAS
ncbi:MAG TPA: TIGR00725 family protein [Longimicrobiales bacterium]|nr:TIGR00725 family protein [Longimicrobiales bacterium]